MCPLQRKAILATCHVDLIKCLAEISLNVLQGVVPINGEQKKKLKRFNQGKIRQNIELRDLWDTEYWTSNLW